MTFKDLGIYFFLSGCICLLCSLFPPLSGPPPLFWKDILLFLGIIPITSGALAIITAKSFSNRIAAWCMFLAGIVGVVVSFSPWRDAIFYFIANFNLVRST